jgi:glutamate-5-semialdehyde dehydrogenase
MNGLGIKAKIASGDLFKISEKKKNDVLKQFSIYLKKNKKLILKANKKDIRKAQNIKGSMLERLKLDELKINQMISSVRKIIKFSDPVGKKLASWKRPNGLIIKRISIPIGVIGVIYESRPNVTSDVASLCFKSGNAVILRGGSEAFHSNKILSNLFRKALKNEGCNENCIQFIKNKNRKSVDYLLSKMQNYIDIIIPRGGKSLVKKVKAKSKVPVIGHLQGICHIYVDRDADLEMAIKIVKNAKMRNFTICGAVETLLIDRKCTKTHCEPILKELTKSGCAILGDNFIKKNFSKEIKIAKIRDWKTEHLSPIISVKSVSGVEDAVFHINKYGTSHTDSIVTKNKKTAKKFLSSVDSSIVLHNASTQFADGGEFGFGAEVGISTEKLHPRGPVGLDQLTTYKYVLKGKGQIRK